MARGNYGQGKRQRENEKARKKRDKAERRARKREEGPQEPEVVTQEELLPTLPTSAEAIRMMERRASQPRQASTPPCRLFVGGLSWETTEESLLRAFRKFGPVVDSAIIKDRTTGDSRGFGFVTMERRKDATKAIDELNDTDLEGRNIVVKLASERER